MSCGEGGRGYKRKVRLIPENILEMLGFSHQLLIPYLEMCEALFIYPDFWNG